jgi:hypothetical protein
VVKKEYRMKDWGDKGMKGMPGRCTGVEGLKIEKK